MIKTEIVASPLPPLSSDEGRRDSGAELVFQGRVRADERGREIVALDYEAYWELATPQLQQLAVETSERFPIHDLYCGHRVGRVPVGEAAVRVVIWSGHRAEGLAAMAWFIDQLKARVPIWKWAVTADGERFPSRCDHAEPGGHRGG